MKPNKNQQVRIFQDQKLGLKVVLVIDSPGSDDISIGGCRVGLYPGEDEAINDAKLLARNMTLKYKVVGLPFNGLKLVVYEIDNSKRKESFEQIGRWINKYEGDCYLATDYGSSLEDMACINNESPYVIDLSQERGGFGSFIPLLTNGVINGLKAAIEYKYNTSDFSGLSAYVLGLGNSGSAIAGRLLKEECLVFGFDLDQDRNTEAESMGVRLKRGFLESKYDLFVPCSAGHAIDENNFRDVHFDIIGGSANRPVAPNTESSLYRAGILVLPDFVVSSGAIVLDDLFISGQKPSLEEGIMRTNRIYEFTKEILKECTKNNCLPSENALRMLGY